LRRDGLKYEEPFRDQVRDPALLAERELARSRENSGCNGRPPWRAPQCLGGNLQIYLDRVDLFPRIRGPGCQSLSVEELSISAGWRAK